ncbi:MAG: hypothetical protein KKD28_02565 [Chloroflexi bacterium]|nr:hypothetical protein [Chloroflexota bacterium]MBU1660338.1 hypothetical protein [Chloroflexota bacterium]
MSTSLILITHTLPKDWITSLAGRCRIVTGPVDATELASELETQLGIAEGLLTLLTIPVRYLYFSQLFQDISS